jgi:hypothetical protein
MSFGIDMLTPRLLTDALRDVCADRSLTVVTIDLQPLTLPTAHNSLLYRATIAYADDAHAGPSVAIVKAPHASPASEDVNESAVLFQPGPREEWFYRRVSNICRVRVPKCYFGRSDRSRGEAILLLEDLSDSEAVTQVAGVSEDKIRQAIDAVAGMHAHWWERTAEPPLDDLRALIPADAAEDNFVNQLFTDAWPVFCRHATFDVPGPVMRLGDAIAKHGVPPAARQLIAPRTLVHGDYRVDNMLFVNRTGVPECVAIDWQDVRFGHGVAEIAWLIPGCMTSVDADQERGLLQHYVQRLNTEGIDGYDIDACTADYRRAMLDQFVQGVLSGTIWEPEQITDDELQFAIAIGGRYVEAAARLEL